MLRAAISLLLLATGAWAICNGPEMYRIPDGSDYRGYINRTSSGIVCQAWTSSTPHHISVTVPDVYKGLGNHNYCRNPFGDAAPGCFTIDESVPYELCSVGPVCSDPIVPIAQSLVLTPPGGNVTVGSFITLDCLPKPCDVYAAIGDNKPSSEVTKGSVVVPDGASMTLIATALFPDGGYKSTRVVYVVTPAPKDLSVALLPSADVVYTAPVLVELVGGGSASSKMIFFGDSTNGVLYKEPFWVYATAVITAVVGDTLLKVTYTINTPVRLPAFYPTGGVFVGAAFVTVVPSVTREVFYFRTSADGDWILVPTDNNTITVTSVGVTNVFICSSSIDVGASEVRNATIEVVAAQPPTCEPTPGTYVGTINVTCSVSGKVMVDSLCVNGACSFSSTTSLVSTGTFNVTGVANNGFGSTVVSSYLYTVVPKQLPPPTPTVCEGSFSGPILFGVAAEGQQAITPIVGEGAGRLDAYGSQWILTPLSSVPSNITVVFVAIPLSTLVAVPEVPLSCTMTLYPADAGKWSPYLRTDIPVESTPVIASLSLGNFSALEFTVLPVGGVLVRVWVASSLVALYMRRLWDGLVAMGNVGVRSEVGAVPVTPLVGGQLNRTTLLECATVCPGRFVTFPQCSCLPNTTTGGDVFETVPSFAATLEVVEGGSFLTGAPIRVVLSSIGDASTRKELVVVNTKFRCEAVGSPLLLVGDGIYTSTVVYAGSYKVCADDGNGLFEVPYASNAYLTVANVHPPMTTLSPCGAVSPGLLDVYVRGDLANSLVSVDGKPWASASGVISIDLSGAAQQVISVVTYAKLQGTTHTIGSQSCLYHRAPSSVDLSGATFAIDGRASLDSGIYSVSIRFENLPTSASDALLQAWVTEGACGAIPPSASYVTSNWVENGTTIAVSTDTPQQIPANSSSVFNVCLATPQGTSIPPRDLFLTAPHIVATQLTPQCNCTVGAYCTNISAPMSCLCVSNHTLVACATEAPTVETESSAPSPLVSVGILAGIGIGIAAAVLIRRSMNSRQPPS